MIGIAGIPSPVGPLTLAARGPRVCLLSFGSDDEAARRRLARCYPGEPIEPQDDPAGAVTALAAYFAGQLGALDGIGVELTGTAFQRQVWEALRRIPAGRTASYAEIARAIQAPAAVRAVGAANGANPVAVIVPCHRVIGSNGTLTGYGGGLERKRWLLEHEGGVKGLW
ncbi:MAG: methylated-DNA-[protein]-cysteine S-methyltransferase [Acidobacteriota bacterium]|jgi:methylated-DNA-[protein]-cysteine S-methyltransferase